MINLIPPWAQALIVVAILSAVGAWGYHKGYQSRDTEAQLQAAAELAKDVKLAKHQQELTQRREASYEAEIRRLNSLPAKVIHDRVATYVSSLCDTTHGQLPSVGKSSGVGNPEADGDAAIRRTDLLTNIIAAQHNKAQLEACRGWIIDHGFGP